MSEEKRMPNKTLVTLIISLSLILTTLKPTLAGASSEQQQQVANTML
jgi:hypothetical protein